MASTLTHPEWDKETSGLEVAKAFADQIRGKNVLITGVSPESIGSSIALSIASQAPALLLLLSRTKTNLDEVLKSIQTAYPSATVKLVILDLSSQESVKAAANEVTQLSDRLDLVINNAGLMTLKREWTKEGIEAQFGVNHVGHFLLTNLLLPLLLSPTFSSSPSSNPSRIINLTSLGHRLSPVRFSDYNLEKPGKGHDGDGGEVPENERHSPLSGVFAKSGDDWYNGYVAYGQAKTANILFSVALNERLRGKKGVVSYAVHPGSIWTGLGRSLDADGEAAIRKTSPFWKNLDQGAATVLVAAFDLALDQQNGVLLHDCQMCEAAPYATDSKLAERLWMLSEKLVQKEFKV
ncbi:NAD(P)-binding protein [Clathrospora elynae]|uniref:NAD(P)-binding protein n=1 Tax=Clathrospora elynae TaxID=706981 RepID=A0A6A5S4Y2_9PLEO|nr:NAD(P)-binding protein [Clathrospora elynae]